MEAAVLGERVLHRRRLCFLTATTAVGSADDIGQDVLIQPDGGIVVGGDYDTGCADLNDVVGVLDELTSEA